MKQSKVMHIHVHCAKTGRRAVIFPKDVKRSESDGTFTWFDFPCSQCAETHYFVLPQSKECWKSWAKSDQR